MVKGWSALLSNAGCRRGRSIAGGGRPAVRTQLLVAIGLLVLPSASTPSLAAGQATSGASHLGLSLDNALTRAESASILIRRARANRAAVASLDVGASQLFPANPLASVAVGPRREQVGGLRSQGVQVAAHIEQTLEIAGQRGARKTEVARRIDAAACRELVARVETRARVRAAYIGAQLADAEFSAAQKRVDLVQQLVDGVGARVKEGAASVVDLDIARVEHGRAVRNSAGAQMALSASLSELRVLISVSPETGLELTTPLTAPFARSETIPDLLARAAQHHAELKVIAASQNATDAAIARLNREAIPDPTFFLDFQRDLPGQVFVGAGIAIPLPVWRRHQGDLAVARTERARLNEEHALASREIAADVERAFHAVSVLRATVRLIETEMLPASESAVDLITQGWHAGKFDLFRVIQASREAAEARRGYLQTLGALWTATISLDRAVGAA